MYIASMNFFREYTVVFTLCMTVGVLQNLTPLIIRLLLLRFQSDGSLIHCALGATHCEWILETLYRFSDYAVYGAGHLCDAQVRRSLRQIDSNTLRLNTLRVLTIRLLQLFMFINGRRYRVNRQRWCCTTAIAVNFNHEGVSTFCSF